MTSAALRVPRTDVATGRRRRSARRRTATGALATAVVVGFAVSLMVGDVFYTPSEVLRVIAGQTVPGASFVVGDLRLPRATLALLVGAAFGMGGTTFQTMLRNPLAAPDVIGITSGASAAAVVGIVLLGLPESAVQVLAVTAALGTALVVQLLSGRGSAAGARLILIGIGVAAMLDAVVSAVLVRAASWDLQTAVRWLTGSLNAARWGQALPVAIALAVAGPVLLGRSRALDLLQHGDEAAAALGVRVDRTRLVAVVAAVALVAFSTAATGPIAFVAFLAGPIAARLVGPGGSLLVPAALTGALLVLVADLVAQHALGVQYPVGVVTGVLGAPYLVYLLVRMNRAGSVR